MPKLTSGVPSYRRHKQSGQAIVTLNGRDFLLGPHDTETSHTKYNRLIAEWLANNRQPFTSVQNDLTIADLTARYWRFVAQYYVKNGRPTDEQGCIRAALRPLLKLYENELALSFGPVSLRAVRDRMIAANWARQTINKNVDRIRRMYRWATSEELLPIETYQRLGQSVVGRIEDLGAEQGVTYIHWAQWPRLPERDQFNRTLDLVVR